MYCNLCKRPVDARRQIGVGTLLLVLITGGLWLFLIPFYSKRCSICKSTALSKTGSANLADKTIIISSNQTSGTKKAVNKSKVVPRLLSLIIIGVLLFLGVKGFQFINEASRPLSTSTTQTTKQTVTTQEKQVAAPAKTEKLPAIDEKKALRSDNYFGNYTNPAIKKGSGTAQLKVWQPYLDYYRKLAETSPLFKSFINGPQQLSVQYDEIWIHKNEADDIGKLYWKDDKIQAYTSEKFYESNPVNHVTVNAHQITSIHGRNSILTEITKKK